MFLFRCTVGYLEQGESRASVLESFLTVHYFGAASLLGGAKRGQIDGHVVADFYNTVSSLAVKACCLEDKAFLTGCWKTPTSGTNQTSPNDPSTFLRMFLTCAFAPR